MMKIIIIITKQKTIKKPKPFLPGLIKNYIYWIHAEKSFSRVYSLDRRKYHGRCGDRDTGRENSLCKGAKFLKKTEAQPKYSALSDTWTDKVVTSFYLVNKKALVFFSPPITHLAANRFLLHFIPNQYYLTTYRSARMVVISAAWKLQKKVLFVLKLRAAEINNTFENWYWSLCVCERFCVCLHVFVCICMFMYKKNLGG